MKPKLLITILLLAVIEFVTTARSFSQPPEIEWSRTYGGSDSDIAYSVQQTTDGGYIIAGYTKSFTADSNDAYLVKVDSLGNHYWSRLYGGDDYDGARSVQQTVNGNFILAGRTCSFGAGDNDMYLLRVDNIGDTLWTHTYGGTNTDVAHSVQQTTDWGFIIAGDTRIHSGALTEMFLVKIDSMGDTLWTETYGGNDDRSAYSVKQTNDGGYVIGGCNPLYGGIEYDIYLVKTDSLGNTLWTGIYGGSGEEYARSVQQTSDGGYIIAGWTDSFGAGGNDMYVVKTDSMGDTLWTHTYGGSDGEGAYSIQQTIGGDYIICGSTSSYGAGGNDLYLLKASNLGDTLWTFVYGGSDNDVGSSVDLTEDGGYIIAGYTWNLETPADCWLLKTGPDTAVSGAPVIQWVSHPKNFTLHPAYPNPFNPTTTINYGIPGNNFVSLTIYNILGQRVATLVNGMQLAGDHAAIWNAADHPSGIYFARLQTGNYTKTIKMVLLK